MSSQAIRTQVCEELEKDGRLTAADLVKAATPKNHPMHGDFIWDDKIAGHKYRLQTALRIISSVRITFTTTKMKVSSVAYVRDPSKPPGVPGLISVAKLRTEEELAYEALLREVGNVVSSLERARELSAALDLNQEFEAALDAAMKLQERARRGPSKRRVHEEEAAPASPPA